MINNTNGFYLLECDICGTDAPEVFDSFQDAVDYKKDPENGWKSVKVKGEWQDKCPDCQDDIA